MAKIYGDEKGVKEQWAKLKGAPLKDKVQYIATYYGLAIVITAALILIAVSIIKSVIYNSVPNVISGEFRTETLDNAQPDVFKEDLCKEMGLDPDEYHIDISSALTDMNNLEQVYMMSQKLLARIAAGDLDFLQGNMETFEQYISAENEDDCAFEDLRKILSEETLNRLEQEGRLVCIDTTFAGRMPYLIDITGTDLYNRLGCLTDPCLIGILITAPHPEAIEPLCGFIR